MSFPPNVRRALARLLIPVLFLACGFIAARAAAPGMPARDGANNNAATQSQVAELARERFDVATRGYECAMVGHKPNEALTADALRWLRLRAKARLDVPEGSANRIAFLQGYLQQLKAQEDFEERLAQRQLAGAQAVLMARYQRLEAEMWLAQARER